MSTDNHITSIFPPWQSGSKAIGVSVAGQIIAGHLERTFHGQNMAENHPLLLFM